MRGTFTVSCRRSASAGCLGMAGVLLSPVAARGAAPSKAIAARSLRRWPTEVTPMLIRSSDVSSGGASNRHHCRGMQARIGRAPARAARHYVHAVIPALWSGSPSRRRIFLCRSTCQRQR